VCRKLVEDSSNCAIPDFESYELVLEGKLCTASRLLLNCMICWSSEARTHVCCMHRAFLVLRVRWQNWESKLAYYDRTYGELMNEW
jgi:hypothetical protein